VWLPPEKHRSSQTAFPAMVAPASSSLVTTVASRRGTYPSTARDPFIIGTPARAMLSLTATLRPTRGPSWRVAISVVTYQAPRSLAPSTGHRKGRCGGSPRLAAYSCSTSSYEAKQAAGEDAERLQVLRGQAEAVV